MILYEIRRDSIIVIDFFFFFTTKSPVFLID